MTVTIYHNPDCATSRNVLAMIRRSGSDVNVINYLVNPPTRKKLVSLLKKMKMTPRALLRQKDTPYEALALGDPRLTDDELIDAMMAHPILINRPIVVTPRGTILARPSERVLEVLPNADIGPFTKEDGEVVIGLDGKRVR